MVIVTSPAITAQIMMNVKLGKTSVKTMNFVSILTAFTSVYQNYPVLQITFKSLTRDVTEKAAKVVTKPALIKRFRRRAYGLSGCVTTKLRQQSSTIAFLLMATKFDQW